MSAVWEMDGLSLVQKLLLLKLADYANDDGSNVYPSIKTLAQKVGVDRRTVQRNLRHFEDVGLLAVVSEAGRHIPRSYRLVLPEIMGGTAPPLKDLGAAPATLRGGTERDLGAAPAPPESSIEPSVNRARNLEKLKTLKSQLTKIGNPDVEERSG